MSVDSDEDVIFENSALHQHLQFAGVEDLKTEPYQTQKVKSQAAELLDKPIQHKVKRKWAMEMSEWFSYFHLKTVLHHLELVSKNQIYVKLRQSPTLEPDDVNFLEEFLGPCVEDLNKGFRKMTGLIAVVVVIIAILCRQITVTNLSFQHLFFSDPVVVMATSCLMLLIGCSLFLFVKQKKLDEQTQIFEEFLKNLVKFQSALKKSIRLIQESELVARGFTLVNNRGALQGLERRSARKTARQCPELRHRVFHAARDSMMYIRNSTQLLIKKFYPESKGEAVSHHFAFIPLEEYGPFVHLRGNSLEEMAQLVEATDNFSLAALKGISNLWNLQQSEFVRCLAICFQSLSQLPSTKPRAVSVPRILKQIMSLPGYKLEENLTSLQHCYDFHHASNAVTEDTKRVPDFADNSQLRGLYVAVHSLDLHLQSALRMSRSLASDIEKQMEKEDSELSFPNEAGSDWMKQMECVKAELAACQDCWSEGQIQGDRLFGTKPNLPNDIAEDTSPRTSAEPAAKPVIQIVGDPVIEDDVFEAYVDDEDEDLQTPAWDEFLSAEDKAKKKREKDEALRLLSELKTVISGLADERKKREDKILLAKLGVVEGEHGSGAKPVPETAKPDSVQQVDDSSTTHPAPILQSVHGSLPSNSVESQHALLTETENSNSVQDHQRALIPDFSLTSELSSTAGAQQHGDLSNRLERLSGANLSFTATLAAQAVAKSRLLGLESETFGDDDDDSDLERETDDIDIVEDYSGNIAK